MASLPKTIFPNTPSSTPENRESNKISYWLEKLFNQEKEKIEKKEREDSQEGSHSKKVIQGSSTQSVREELITEKEGLVDAIRGQATKEGDDKNKLKDMVSSSNRILKSVSSMRPWDIFPSTINVEATRVTIIHRQLFSSQVHSVDIKDISNIFMDQSLFLATLTIVSGTFTENEIKIVKLRKKEAILVRRILEGLRMLVREDINTAAYTIEELLSKLKELSTTKIVV